MQLPFELTTSLPLASQHAVKRWIDAPVQSRFIFGRTEVAHQILQHYRAAGVIDDFTDQSNFDGVPVMRSSDLPAASPVLSAVIGKPATVKKVCEQRGLDHVDFFAFQKACGNPNLLLRFWHDSPADLFEHSDAYATLWHALADEASRQVLQSVLSLRLSGDLSLMAGFTERQHEQYFEPFLDLEESGESFLDIGGFDGATSVEFARRCPGYEAIHIFEPDPQNIRVLEALNVSMERVRLYPVALGPEAGELRFTSADSRSHFSDCGEHSVSQVRLDDLGIRQGTFLKMDIEGAELGAIAGSANFIRRYQPRLAIAAYHKVDDLWRIPAAIRPLMEADIYLRHYTEGLDETVMFFIPRTGEI